MSLLTAPPVALACYAVAIVGTHLTGLMDEIMQITWAGQLEHLVYLVVGCQFFTLILGDEPIRWRLSAPARWLLLAIAMAVDTFTGVVLIQATSPIAMLPAPRLSVDALADTHTGGAIMWVGGDAIMAVVMVVLVVSWLYRPARARPTRDGWAERARRATFEAHTGRGRRAPPSTRATSPTTPTRARRAYNDGWHRRNRAAADSESTLDAGGCESRRRACRQRSGQSADSNPIANALSRSWRE